MKILELELNNIQSHIDNKFTFSPFLNVIKGISNSSDIGKSVVVKGLRLLIENKASKRIRTRGATSPSSVTVSDENVTISRIKDDKLNGYILKEVGKEDKEFKAIKTDIPYDVQKAMNLSEVNIQRQKDTFFLIDESSGQVAKELNKVSGLSTIDATLKRITSEINTITSSIRTQNEIIEKCKHGIEYTKWAEGASKDLEEIESLTEDIDDLKDKNQNVSSLVDSYSHYAKQIKCLLPESIVDDYKELISIQDETYDLKGQRELITNHVNSYGIAHEQLKNISVLDLSEINSIQEEIDALSITKKDVQSLVTSYNSLMLQIKSTDEKLDDILGSLGEIEVCPTCGRPMEVCDDMS